MVIECKVKPGDNVKILPLERTDGVVIAVWLDSTGMLQYQIRYFNQGKAEKEYFFEKELEGYSL